MSKNKKTLKRDPVKRKRISSASFDDAVAIADTDYYKKKQFTQRDLDDAIHKAKPEPNTLELIVRAKADRDDIKQQINYLKGELLNVEDQLKSKQNELTELSERLLKEVRS